LANGLIHSMIDPSHDAAGRSSLIGADPMRSWANGWLIRLIVWGIGLFVTISEAGAVRERDLNRRLRTDFRPGPAATPLAAHTGLPVHTRATFDPEAECLEIGLRVRDSQNWLLYGPDLSSTYGGLGGQGRLEAVIDAQGVPHGVVHDWWGNVVAHLDRQLINRPPPGCPLTEANLGPESIHWHSGQMLAWGPTGTSGPLRRDLQLVAQLGYRGTTLDPTGLLHQGLRLYDPERGRWLSPDPAGSAGSFSLYDYCDNDPVNFTDPDGRFGMQVADKGWRGASLTYAGKAFDIIGNYGIQHGDSSLAMWAGGGASLLSTLGGMSSTSGAIGAGLSYSGRISTVYNDSRMTGEGTFSSAVLAGGYGLTSWNGISFMEGAKNQNVFTGNALGDWTERGAKISSGVAGFVGAASLGISGVTFFSRPAVPVSTTPPPLPRLLTTPTPVSLEADALAAKTLPKVPTTRADLHIDLRTKGFEYKSTSGGGYVTYKHADGWVVTVKPTGEVIPTSRATSQTGKTYNQRTDYDGNRLPDQSHSTDHFVETLESLK
jgi:RHS repeat-associated protein